MYENLLQRAKKIYNLPTSCLDNVISNYSQDKQSYSSRINIEIKNKKIKNNKPLVYFRIKKSRANITYNLSDLIFDKTTLYSCHPIDIIEIGCYSKEVEIYQQKYTYIKKNTYLYEFLSKFKKSIKKTNDCITPVLPLEVMNIYSSKKSNQKILIDMNIINTKAMFTIPLTDFILDDYLLFNTSSNSLIKIGYVASEITNKFTLNMVVGAYG